MKRFLLLICLALCGVAFGFSQNYQDVVYLKSGSVIRGVVVEQVPGVSLKVQTSDGNMFVYEMSEVEKMTKEASPRQYGRQGNNYGGLQNLSRGYRPNGYRGFMELGGGPGVGDYGDGFVSFSTSHGGQISPYFFLGAGIGFDYHFGWETISIPIFADLRANFLDNWITPYFGAKIGYSVFDITGFYFNPTLGVDFALDSRLGFNFSLGYNLQSAVVDSYYYGYYGFYSMSSRRIIGGVTFNTSETYNNSIKTIQPLRISARAESLLMFRSHYLFNAVAASTAQATVQPTIGLLPMPRKPIISTCAGTEDEPANCASLCIRPIVSVMP